MLYQVSWFHGGPFFSKNGDSGLRHINVIPVIMLATPNLSHTTTTIYFQWTKNNSNSLNTIHISSNQSQCLHQTSETPRHTRPTSRYVPSPKSCRFQTNANSKFRKPLKNNQSDSTRASPTHTTTSTPRMSEQSPTSLLVRNRLVSLPPLLPFHNIRVLTWITARPRRL